MDKKQFAVFCSALKTYYPRENLLPNAQAMELWFRQLEDLPFDLAEAVLNRWVATSKWPPTIAEIRESATELAYGKEPDWGEEWANVLAAVRKYGYMNPEKARAALSERAWSAVEWIGGWQQVCWGENTETDRANFRMCYETAARRETQERQLPASVRTAIAGIKMLNA